MNKPALLSNALIKTGLLTINKIGLQLYFFRGLFSLVFFVQTIQNTFVLSAEDRQTEYLHL